MTPQQREKMQELAETYASTLISSSHEDWRKYYLAFKAGFTAAHDLREAEIAELKRTSERLKEVNKDLENKIPDLLEYRATVRQLQEQVRVLRETLKQVQKHGLHHYEDCKNREYDDQLCNCGMEKAEMAILEALTQVAAMSEGKNEKA